MNVIPDPGASSPVAGDAVLQPVDDQDVPDAPAEEEHPDERDQIGDDQRDERAVRRADPVPREEAIHARMLAGRARLSRPEGHASPGVRSGFAPVTLSVFSSAPRTMTSSYGGLTEASAS